jgi:hypothetical protein
MCGIRMKSHAGHGDASNDRDETSRTVAERGASIKAIH